MNNKGFSMIELLGVIVIIAVLAGVAIPAVTKYISKTRNRAYDNIYESAVSAAEAKYMHDLAEGTQTYKIKDELYEMGYMDAPIDPSNKTICDGTVVVEEIDDEDGDSHSDLEISEYKYKVTLDCSGECRSYYSGKDSTDKNGEACI